MLYVLSYFSKKAVLKCHNLYVMFSKTTFALAFTTTHSEHFFIKQEKNIFFIPQTPESTDMSPVTPIKY